MIRIVATKTSWLLSSDKELVNHQEYFSVKVFTVALKDVGTAYANKVGMVLTTLKSSRNENISLYGI